MFGQTIFELVTVGSFSRLTVTFLFQYAFMAAWLILLPPPLLVALGGWQFLPSLHRSWLSARWLGGGHQGGLLGGMWGRWALAASWSSYLVR